MEEYNSEESRKLSEKANLAEQLKEAYLNLSILLYAKGDPTSFSGGIEIPGYIIDPNQEPPKTTKAIIKGWIERKQVQVVVYVKESQSFKYNIFPLIIDENIDRLRAEIPVLLNKLTNEPE